MTDRLSPERIAAERELMAYMLEVVACDPVKAEKFSRLYLVCREAQEAAAATQEAELTAPGPCGKHPYMFMEKHPEWTEAEHGEPLMIDDPGGISWWCALCVREAETVGAVLAQAISLYEKAFEQNWVVQDTIDAIRALNPAAIEAASRRERETERLRKKHFIQKGESPWRYCSCGWGSTKELGEDSLQNHLRSVRAAAHGGQAKEGDPDGR